MLSRFDDYPIHQTAEPLFHAAGDHPNHYDRYFFHGYARDGSLYFGVAMGVYPGRGVIDASLTVVTGDGLQRSLHASGRLGTERADMVVGPIRVEVVHPMRSLRVKVDAGDLGMSADLLFEARTPAVQEPRHRWSTATQTMFDSTRMTQWGRWRGMLSVDGTTTTLDPTQFPGCRDRSWGQRPVGDQIPTAPATTLPQFFWLWAPIHLDDGCLHVAVNEHDDGRRWYQSGGTVADLGADPPDPALVSEAGVVPWRGVDWEIDWEPGTRRAREARWTLTPPMLGVEQPTLQVTMTPILTALMRGMGYTDPDWGHGRWHGDASSATRTWSVSEEEPTAIWNLHVQQVCDVAALASDGAEHRGIGVLEILPLGPHRPSGLSGFNTGYEPQQ